MIYGIGTDIVEIDRIKKIKSHDTFANKILGSDELQEYKKLKGELKIPFLGKHFAAKEAFVKALGTGFIKPVFPKGIQVISSNNGKPKYLLSNSVKVTSEIFPKISEAIDQVFLRLKIKNNLRV